MRVPRTRGAISGLVVALLGLWGALIPFVGPAFDYAIGPTDSWHWTAGRFWLSVVPGVVAIVGGLMLMTSARRPTAALGATLGVAAGAWFVVGPTVSMWWNDGVSAAGVAHGSTTTRVLAELGWHLGLGALILSFAAAALGRLSVRSVRDVELAEADGADRAEPAQQVAPAEPTAGERPRTRPARAGFRTRRGATSSRSAPPAERDLPPSS